MTESHMEQVYSFNHQNGRAGEQQVAEFQESHGVEVKVLTACV